MVMYLFALMTAARIYGRFRRLRRANFVDAWQDYLASDRPPLTAKIIVLHPDEVEYLMRCWNLAFEHLVDTELHSSQGWERRKRLRDIAYAVGLTHAAEAFAFRGRTREQRIAGIQCLGAMGRPEIAPKLLPVLESDEAHVALAAFEAVARIAPDQISDRLADLICQHPEWPEHVVSRVIRVLSEEDRAALAQQARDVSPACRSGVISGFEGISHAFATHLVTWHLDTAPHWDDIGKLLYAIREEHHVNMVDERIDIVQARHRSGSRQSGVPGWELELERRLQGWAPLDEQGT